MAKPKNILVVDDSKTFITYMNYLLRRMGFNKIIIAENGKEALRILKMWTPDIIILDVLMPIMDGVETLKEIKEDENTTRIPVVMVSSTKGTDREDKCREFGCADFLMKPIKVSQLNDSLQEIMEKTGANRRRHLRTKFKKKVTIIHRGKTETYDAETLSEGGIYVKKSLPLPMGTELEVIVPYRQEQTIQAKGSVIYIKESEDIPLPLPIGMAIQFTGMSEEISRLLSEYVMEIITGKQKL